MLTCREASLAIAADELRSAGFGRRLSIRAHLLMCQNCRAFARQLATVGHAVRRLATSGELLSKEHSAEERILARVRASRTTEQSGRVAE